MDTQTISLRIAGTPIAKGRPRSRIAGSDDKQFVQHYTPASTKRWQHDIVVQAKRSAPLAPWIGPIRCDREYVFTPPKKPKHPIHHIVKPDMDNLDKAFWDALEGVFFIGDQQICAGIQRKRYARPGEEPGIIATFRLLG